VIVTGGSGLVGKLVTEKLLSEGMDVIVIDTKPSPLTEYFKLDITEPGMVVRAFQEFPHTEAVVHLAGIASVVACQNDPARAIRVNISGTKNIVDAAERNGIERFVFMSSAAVYGNPGDGCVSEEHPVSPVNVYGLTKQLGEGFVQEAFPRGSVILRGGTFYGPGQRMGIIPSLYSRIILGKVPVLRGDHGSARRDYVFVNDVADAVCCALSCPGGIYNLGTGTGYSAQEIWESVARDCTGRGLIMPAPEYQPLQPGEVECMLLSSDKARTVMGWMPKVGLDEGVRITMDYLFGGDQGCGMC